MQISQKIKKSTVEVVTIHHTPVFLNVFDSKAPLSTILLNVKLPDLKYFRRCMCYSGFPRIYMTKIKNNNFL